MIRTKSKVYFSDKWEALELEASVIEEGEGGGVTRPVDDEKPEFYSIYLRHAAPDNRAEWVLDTTTKKVAKQFLNLLSQLTGLPKRSYV